MSFKNFVESQNKLEVIWEGEYEGETYVWVSEELDLMTEAFKAPEGFDAFFKDFDQVNKTSVHRFMNKAKMNAKLAKMDRSPSGFLTGLAAGAKKLMSNPFAAGALAAIAVDSYKQYQKNQRATTTFYAKDPYERNFYQKMVDDLVKSGQYRMVKQKYVNGSHVWVLRKR